jgi:hypothetical protein
VAFLDEPHRLTSRQEARQFRKSLSEIRSVDYLLAEQRKRVLYVEDYTDIDILLEWARVLSHPALEFLESPFAVYVGNVVPRARDHFYGLRAAYPELRGALLIDQAEGELDTKGALRELMWRRREIENYLLVPDAVLRLCAAEITRLRKSSPNDNLFSAADLEKAKAILREFVLPDVFVSPLTDTPFLMGTKVSDVVLEPFFKKFFTELHEYNTMPKSKFYRIAEVMEPREIHPEVRAKLDAIAEALELAEGKDLE